MLVAGGDVLPDLFENVFCVIGLIGPRREGVAH
jgi:hypothetical protein